VKRLILSVVLVLGVSGLAGCDDHQAKPESDGAGGSHDCGRADFRTTPNFDDAPEIACMRAALAAHRPAHVMLIQQSTDSGPIPSTYDLDAQGHVALTIDVTDDPHRGSGDPIQQVPCMKPTWLPGASCPPPHPRTRPVPFTVAPGQQVSARTRYVDVLVHPTHCTRDRSGSVLAPTVHRTYGQIQVLFRVSNRPEHVGHCDDVPGIPFRLDLRAPLGERWIVDASCIMPSVYWRGVCKQTRIRARAG
jgi:hypothetical protein